MRIALNSIAVVPAGPRKAAGRAAEACGGTAMYDAIFLAADELLKKQQGRKAVVLLSDGVDNGSKTSIGGAIESAQRADMLVYSIRFADDSNRSPVVLADPGMGRGGRRGMGGRFPQPQRATPDAVDGKKILERISQETGGGYFEVSNKMPLDKIYDQIEEELRNQYSLGYTPDQSSGGYHKILVSVKAQKPDGPHPRRILHLGSGPIAIPARFLSAAFGLICTLARAQQADVFHRRQRGQRPGHGSR